MDVISEPVARTTTFGGITLYLFLTIFAILWVYYQWVETLRYTILGHKIPGIKPLPLVGNALDVLGKTPTEIMQYGLKLAEKYGKVVRFWFGTRLAVALIDPRDVELILGSSTHLEKSSEYSFFKPWLGDGLLINKGDRWRSHRKMIAPTFHQSILKTFVPTFNKNAEEVVEHLRKHVSQVIDIHEYMGQATVDILMETVMGVEKNKEPKTSSIYAKAVMDLCTILHLRHVNLHLRSDFIFRLTNKFREQSKFINIIHGLTDRVIKNKKTDFLERVRKGEKSTLYMTAVKETEEDAKKKLPEQFSDETGLKDDLDSIDECLGEKKRLAFLDFMLEASQIETNNLNDNDIREEVNTLMFEGHDTTAAASSFFLCILGTHPDIQKRVQEEVDGIFQGSKRPVTFHDTLEMKYLERVLLETLRMYPPVPLISRVIKEEVTLASTNLILPVGAMVAIPQFAIHRDPDTYPNPDKFDPDNFLPERCQQRHYYSFIPFSAGPRSCVGRKYAVLKLKILLAEIVRNFHVKSVVEEKDFQLQGDIILKRADGFPITLEERA